MSGFFCLPWLGKQRGVPNRGSSNDDLNKKLQAHERPSYAAMLKFDLYNEGDPPSPVTPPHYTTIYYRPSPQPAQDETPDQLSDNYPSSTSFDLRAPSIPTHRHHRVQKTYFNFRVLKRGQLHTPHYNPETTFFHPGTHSSRRWTLDDSEIPVVNMTPRLFYEEAQRYPKPPRWHYAHRFEMPGRESRGERRRMELMVAGAGREGVGLEEEKGRVYECWMRSICVDAQWIERNASERFCWDSQAEWVDEDGMGKKRRVELGALPTLHDEGALSRAGVDSDAEASDDWEVVHQV